VSGVPSGWGISDHSPIMVSGKSASLAAQAGGVGRRARVPAMRQLLVVAIMCGPTIITGLLRFENYSAPSVDELYLLRGVAGPFVTDYPGRTTRAVCAVF